MSEEEIIDDLILKGGLEVAGVDSENGELLYTFTPKIKELMPELYSDHLNKVNSEIMVLWEKGYINVDFTMDDPIITIAEKALMQSEIDKLSKEERWSLEEMKRLMLGRG